MKEISKWPEFSLEEQNIVSEILKSGKVNYWTGNHGKEFEKEFSLWCGTSFSISLANGTLALDLALKALNLQESDEVIVTPRSFIASVSSVINSGAVPIFAEIDKDSGNMTAETISNVITSKTKAIICVHLAGWPCDMSSIIDLAKSHGIFVIEDCAQAHGAKYKGKSVGSIGHVGTWSFCQDKIITTGGEGGMVTTNDKDLWERMWSYKDHGKGFDSVYKKNKTLGFNWVHESFGSNFRMTEMQAAIGRIQLRKLNSWQKKRLNNANLLTKVCANYPSLLRTPVCPEEAVHAYYRFYTYVRSEGLGEKWNRDKIISEIIKHGVPCYGGSCPEIYLEPAFNETSFRPKQRLPIAKELGETSLVFLVHPSLNKEDLNKTMNAMNEVFSKASKH